MAAAPVLKPVDLNYPKALYKYVGKGKGDLVSPAYEKIVRVDGQDVRKPEFYDYVTCIVLDAEAEKALGSEWIDNPNKLKASKIAA